MSQPLRHTVDVEVRYAETDQMGVVHHANYLVWLELARTDLCRAGGIPYPEIERRGHYLMVVGANLRYLRGARYGDRVRVAVWLDRLRSRDLRFAYEVSRDGDRLATATTDHVWVARDTGRPTRMPEYLAEPFGRLQSGALPG